MPSSVLHARREQIHRARRRAIGGATAIFAATTGGILFQLASGHDPALARSSSSAKQVSSSTSAVATGTPSSSSAASSDGSSSQPLTPVTTSQS
jgi:hypothetical protein